MKYPRLVIFVSSTLIATAGVLLACSGDDTVVGDKPDGTVADGTTSDTSIPDTGVKTDTGDGEEPPLIDAGVKFIDYVGNQAEAFCKSVSRCCFGDPSLQHDASVDGGAFNKDLCVKVAAEFGFEGSLTNVGDGGGANLILDQAKAIECAKQMEAVSCNLGRVEYASIRKVCFESVRGKQLAGQACAKSVECAPGTFCNVSTAKCEALRDVDAACGDFSQDENLALEACSWRGSGDTNRYCELYDLVADDYKDAGDWKCTTGRPLGQKCYDTLWCGDGICDPNDVNGDLQPDYVCRTPVSYFPPGSGGCVQFIK